MSPKSDVSLQATAQYWNRPDAGKLYNQEFKNLVGWYVSDSEMQPIRDLAGHLEGKSILDVGCGTGRHLTCFRPDNKLFGIDQSDEMLGTARERMGQASFQIASAEEIPFDTNSFDLVYSVRVLQHIRNQEQAIREMVRVCKPNGMLIIVSYNSWSLLNLYKHVRMSWLGKILNLPFKMILGRRSFFGPWGFKYDNYCSVRELTKILNQNQVRIRYTWGVTCAMPWLFNSFFIGKILEISVPIFFRTFLKCCLWIDRTLARKFPLKYFTDMVLVAGEKIP